jgi:hypothetical protein
MRSVVSAFACTLFLVGCAGDGPAPGVGVTTSTVGGGGSSLTLIQETIFTPTCALLGCHDALIQSDGLNLSNVSVSYSDLVGQLSNCVGRIRVVAGNPDASYLMDKLGDGLQAPCGEVMPLGMASLSSDDLQLIRDWIADGALPASFEIAVTTTTTTTSSTVHSENW